MLDVEFARKILHGALGPGSTPHWKVFKWNNNEKKQQQQEFYRNMLNSLGPFNSPKTFSQRCIDKMKG